MLEELAQSDAKLQSVAKALESEGKAALINIGQSMRGPLLITEQVSTTFIAPGWECVREESGSLLLTKI